MLAVRIWYDKGHPEVEVHAPPRRVDPSELSNMAISDSRYCIGYLTGEKHEYVPCGKKTNGYQCEECMRKHVFTPCARCHGFSCSAGEIARKWCFQPFTVYLAYFGGQVVKVGVAAEVRLRERLLEQGALAYKVLSRFPDGMAARREEYRLFSRYRGSLRPEDKVSGYRDPDLSWFDSSFPGETTVLMYSLQALNKIQRYRVLRPTRIPEVLGAIGDLLITPSGLIPFSHVRGRKLFPSRSLLDY